MYVTGLLLLIQSVCYCQTSTGALENRVKAAYIYNFTKFVYWNTQAQNNNSTPMSITIIGDEPICAILDSFLNQQGITPQLRVKTAKPEEFDLTGCHIVYIGKIAEHKLPVILKRIENTGILSVSDISAFTAKGGMIGFYLDNGKVKIEINMTAVANEKLQISAKLLEVARLTKSGKTE
jgi:hypothetical protein